MRKAIALLFGLWLSAGITLSAQGREFTIRGGIAGLEAGDTLRFERIGLPRWDLEPAFEVVVKTSGRFEYTGRQPQAEYYMMTCLPRTGQLPETGKRGLTMIVDGGTVTLTGNRDEIYLSRIEGEAFGEQPLLREAEEIEKSVDRERARFLQLGREALAAGDSVKGREYIRQFNEFWREDESKRIGELQREFLARYPSSPWSLVYRLERSSNAPVDTLEAHYGRLDAAAREGRWGTILRRTIDERARLLPGNPAPDFKVTLPDGTVMDSGAFRGKYLLIYHWGFCPGSVQLEKQATELYNRFRDHIEVLGITESLEAVRETARTIPSEEKMFGMTLKPIYESMAVHPWIDVEDGTGENKRIGERYAFGGFPYFVLVSPEGTIVSRGYHETFFEAKKILETQYDKK